MPAGAVYLATSSSQIACRIGDVDCPPNSRGHQGAAHPAEAFLACHCLASRTACFRSGASGDIAFASSAVGPFALSQARARSRNSCSSKLSRMFMLGSLVDGLFKVRDQAFL